MAYNVSQQEAALDERAHAFEAHAKDRCRVEVVEGLEVEPL